MKTFQGKTVLITGASSGIGKAFAENLAGRGANLVITARSKDKLDELANQLRQKKSATVNVIALDLGQPDAAARLFQRVQQKKLGIDVLINNAGFGKWGAFLDVDKEAYAQMLQLNITALVELCHLFLPGMIAKGDGGIINVASTAAFAPVPYAGVYSASKSFVLSFSESLYGEYGSRGVQVTALCPGATESNFAQVASASPDVNIPKSAVDSAEFVAGVGLDAFLKGECYVISGTKNYPIAWIPRLLPRKKVIGLVGGMWKRILDKRATPA